MSETLEIETPENESVEIEVEELSALEQVQWGAKAPEAIRGPAHESKVTPDVVQFLVELVESQTILTRGLLNELNRQQLNKVFNRVAQISFNGGRVEDGEIRDFSGGVDLEDWR